MGWEMEVGLENFSKINNGAGVLLFGTLEYVSMFDFFVTTMHEGVRMRQFFLKKSICKSKAHQKSIQDLIDIYDGVFFATAHKVSKYGVFPGMYFSFCGLHTGMIFSVDLRIQENTNQKEIFIWTLFT